MREGELHLLSQFCLECFLLDYDLCQYLPSQMASVSLCVASRIIHPESQGANALTNALTNGGAAANKNGENGANKNGENGDNNNNGNAGETSNIAGKTGFPLQTPGYDWYGEGEMERVKDELLRVIALQKDKALGKKYAKDRYKEVIKYIRQFE